MSDVQTPRENLSLSGESKLAIVGVSFRFPGPGGDAFWQALCEGRNLVTSVHDSRWSREAYLHPRPSEPGRSYTFAAGSIGDVSGFDAAFFGISPREAAQMDPQQRLLLELTWEALESGGIRPSALRGSRTGVLIGFSGSDYGNLHIDDLDSVDAFFMTGCSASIAANRVSYCYDFRGPSLAIDTACSSALTAFHLACEAVSSGSSDLAVTGAVNLHLHPLPFISFSKASMLSPAGACRAFDAEGEGYVRSEGCAIVVLKRLADAIADGNRIFAVVAGTAVNCDGKTNGLTVPSAEAQAALLTEVYARAGIAPAEIDYLEAHGTGTGVGDPIEAQALGQALGRARPANLPLRIGSVKTNIGHLETVAGMAGLVKAVYCLQHRAVPGSLHFETPNPRIPFAELNLEVVRELRPLEAGRRLVIGVNSFGFGGANAHVILESPPAAQTRASPQPRDAAPILVSGRSEAALRAAAQDMADWLAQREDLSLHDIAQAAAQHRDWHKHRAIVFADDRPQAAAQLAEFARQGRARAVAAGRALDQPGEPVFVYSGNGAQWPGMGRTLLEEDASFRAAVERVDAIFRRHSPLSIVDALKAEDIEARLDATEIAQPLLFAVQVGLTESLRDCGVRPGAVLGHSVGEIAAAWACGALSLENATRIVFHRSAWQGRTRGAGGMTAVRIAAEELRALLGTFAAGARLAIAAFNAPHSVTVAGAAGDLDALEQALRRLDKPYSRLALDYAFHSAAMDPIEADLLQSLADLQPRAGRIPFVSAVSGRHMSGDQLGPAYWWRNIREPVRFAEAAHCLRAGGAAVYMEIGPKPILGGYLAECLGAAWRECRVVQTMAPGSDDRQALRRCAFEVTIAGCPTDFGRFFPEPSPYVDLPGYPWQRERHWYEPSPGSQRLLQRRAPHPLLGHRLRDDIAEWESRLDVSRLPAYADHRVSGEIVFPAAGFAELALAACAALREENVREIEDLTIHAPLVLDRERSNTVRLTVDAGDGHLRIQGRRTGASEDWRLHATGRIPLHIGTPFSADDFVPPVAAQAITADSHYAALAARGLEYGPAFRIVTHAWVEPGVVTALLAQPAAGVGEGEPAQLEPSALDACFQLIVHLQKPDPDGAEPLAFVPVRIGRLSVVRPGQRPAYAVLRETQRGPRSSETNCILYGADRRAVAFAEAVRSRALPRREAGQLIAMRARAIALPIPGCERGELLPPVEQLRAACAARLHGPERLAARRRYYEVVEPLLEAMLSAFAREALPAIEAPGSAQFVDPRRADLIRKLAGNDELPPAAEIWSELLADNTDQALEVLQLGRIGQRFGDLARRTVSIEATAAELADFHDAVVALVACAGANLPIGRRLRVATVAPEGSGLGASMVAALDSDRADCRSGSGLAQLQGTGGAADILVLDCGGMTDAVDALGHARDALAPGGLLALLVPVPTRSASLADDILAETDANVYGIAPREHALVRALWNEALAACGLEPAGLIEDTPGIDAGPFILLARAEPVAGARAPAPTTEGAWLLLNPGEPGLAPALAECLRAELLGRGVLVLPLSVAATSTRAWASALEQARASHGSIAGIVVLPGQAAAARAPLAALEHQVERCDALGGLFEACSTLGIGADLWVVTERAATGLLPDDVRRALGEAPQPDQAPVWGFVRSACSEYPGLSLRLADLAAPRAVETMAASLADALLRPDAEDEVVLTPNGRYAVRVDAQPLARLHAALAPAQRTATCLDIPAPGQLSSLAWIRRPLRALADDDVEIDVRAAGLNFRDVMYAMGQLSEEALETGFAGLTLGMELSGVVAAVGAGVSTLAPGDRVFACASASFGTRVVTPAGYVLKMPQAWSFKAAATVPVAFLTAYYALHHLAHLQEGERVLIHGAAGGVGMAAIQIARNAGAEIFATAGSEVKRDIVRLLGADHVMDSRSLDFASELLARTGGQGVDVVLNSLSGEAMRRSLQVLRPLGRFLELGKRDYYENSRIGMRPFRNNIAYFGIDLDQLMRERPTVTRRMMHDLLSMFEEGTLSPLPYREFPAADPEAAFRFMQQSRHVGKIVLSLDPAPRAGTCAPLAQPTLRLPADAAYLVTGGLGGFGLRTARWLAEKGARHLVLVGRGVPDAQAAREIAALTAAGVRVRPERCDVADHGALQRLLQSIRGDMPPLRGIVHAAGVYRDGLIRGLDRKALREVLAPKMLGALNLHRLTQGLPLDFLVLYSSATTTFGNPGQANYVAANRFLEVLADARRAQKLPTLCVGWGPIADAGYLERNPEIREQVAARMGVSAISSAQALEALERLLAGDLADAAVLKASPASLGRLAAATRAARFRDLVPQAGDAAASVVDSGELERWLAGLDDAGLAAMLAELLREQAAAVLRLPVEQLDPTQPLQELGFDSLMRVELMTAVEARFGVAIPAGALSEFGTLEKLAARLAQELRRDGAGAAPDAAEALGAQARRLAAQHAAAMSNEEIADAAAALRRPAGRSAPADLAE
jgi:acyl transferase domain-containing protein/NADPH:quinone reductase-like Zn-dependent oxidoreductase/short-subunit dehydrogenase/acyl carrier protein